MEATMEKERNNEENEWKSPPLPNRRTKKGTKASLTVHFNDQCLVQEYKDISVGNTYSNNNQGNYSGQLNTAPNSGNKIGNSNESSNYTNTVTIHDGGTQTGMIINQQERNIINQKMLQQLLQIPNK